jgi:hypothetical protein
MTKKSRQPAEPDIDWSLCERIACLPETTCSPDEIDMLFDLAPKEQDAILAMLNGGTAATIGQAFFELRFAEFHFLWRHFATVKQRHQALHAIWNSLDRLHRHRLQIELGIGSPWPHDDFSKRDLRTWIYPPR